MRVAIGAIVWLTLFGIAAAQTGIPTGTQLNPDRVSAGNKIVIGCVSRQAGGAAPAFVITDGRQEPPAQYRLDGDADLLRMHVGHTVEIAGSMTPASGGASAAVPTLKVQSLIYISTTCSQQK